MPQTTKPNLFIPQVLADMLGAEITGKLALYGSSAVIVNPGLTSKTLGDTVHVPYWNSLGEFQQNVSEATPLTPVQLTSDKDTATVRHDGLMFDITKWAANSGAGDPYAEGVRQLKDGVQRAFDRGLVEAALTGIDSSMTVDITANTVKTLCWDNTVDARIKFGDEQANIALLVVHSKVYGDLLKEKDSSGRPLLVDMRNGELSVYNGIPVMVSDRCPVAAGKYTSLMVKRGALALWYNDNFEVQEDTNISVDSKQAAIHLYFVAHRYRRTQGDSKSGVVKILSN